MLDVHPPHSTTHTWKDFFIHIATICVGLLIAVGLEQAVERIHRAHEASELRRSLASETDKILRDSADGDAKMKYISDWLQKCSRQINDAALHNQPVEPLPPLHGVTSQVPADPVFRSAKASGQLALLTPEEVQAYSEVDFVIEESAPERREFDRLFELITEAYYADYFGQPAGTSPFAHASREQLQHIYTTFGSLHTQTVIYQDTLRHLRGAELAISHGERDLDKIQAAESQFAKLP